MCIGILGSFAISTKIMIPHFAFSLSFVFFTDKKFYFDDDDSGIGPSISTERKHMLSEVCYRYFIPY